MDCFSALPDELLLQIIAFLPTKFAVRSALISRRFRALWAASASTFLNLDAYSKNLTPFYFMNMAEQTFSRCNAFRPLFHLRVRLQFPGYFHSPGKPILSTSKILFLIDKASALGLRHLSLQLCSYEGMWPTILPCILSHRFLVSLSLKLDSFLSLTPKTPINLRRLRSLSINVLNKFPSFAPSSSGSISRLVSQLTALDDLHITSSFSVNSLDLKSATLKKLKLDVNTPKLRISAPCLELFELESKSMHPFHPWDWDWEMPVLRKAVIRLTQIYEENVGAIFKMLNSIANVEELHIDIVESWNQVDIFHALLLPDLDPPTFSNLKHLNIEVSFHQCNIEDVVALIQHSPALESLKLVHKPPFGARREKRKALWQSKLRPSGERNCKHAYFKDLCVPGKKEAVVERLIGKPTASKKLKA